MMDGRGECARVINERMGWRMKGERWSFLELKWSLRKYTVWAAFSKARSPGTQLCQTLTVLSKKYKKGRGHPVVRIVWKTPVFHKVKKVSSWQDFSEPLLGDHALQISPGRVDHAVPSRTALVLSRSSSDLLSELVPRRSQGRVFVVVSQQSLPLFSAVKGIHLLHLLGPGHWPQFSPESACRVLVHKVTRRRSHYSLLKG